MFRLTDIGPGGSTVVAKRCRQETAWIELTVYEEVLPHLPVVALHYYGCVEEVDTEFCWLFLEDAGTEHYSPFSEEHRAAAGRWLGLVHTSASQTAAPVCLPDRGPRYYLQLLTTTRDTVQKSLANPALRADDSAILQHVIGQCAAVERRWDEVEKLCGLVPRTLVHGDLAGSNVRIRRSKSEIIILPLDWEMAGWGVPAVDLAQSQSLHDSLSAHPDLRAYSSVVREYWPSLDCQTVQRLASYGRVFRILDAIQWLSWRFADVWVERAIGSMKLYQAELASAMLEVGWTP